MSNLTFLETAKQVRDVVADWRDRGSSIALVPTMGNLHDGHLSLAALAGQLADRVVMTIFVNPTQFGIGEDFGAYPRTLERDREILMQAESVDALFVPDEKEIYPFGVDRAVRISMPALSRELCGASRPGHFDGVASVVLRLLNIVSPDVLVLGNKDYQQLKLIELMIADLRLVVRVVAGPTIRHEDGLAISSRNAYLASDERERAPSLNAALRELALEVLSGKSSFDDLQRKVADKLRAQGFEPDYVEIRRASDLSKPNGKHRPEELVALAAARIGRTRLIDNVCLADLVESG